MNKPVFSENTLIRVVKQHWGQVVALLARYLKDLDRAEDAMQDALESALTHWKKNGIPNNPNAWLFTTAKHKALDKLRRSHNFIQKKEEYQQLMLLSDISIKEDEYCIPDERLRLILTCCHPALDHNTAVALTLKMICGLQMEEIAKALIINPSTLAQRLVRGKKKIKLAKIPYQIPEKQDLLMRIDMVLQVIYLIFNEGYSASSGDHLARQQLTNEAIRLCQLLLKLMPQEPEIQGLLALMYLHDSRYPARFDQLNGFIPLSEQNRSLWSDTKKDAGLKLITIALKKGKIGFYQLQAAISAVHSRANSYESTDWQEVILLYEQLLHIKESDVVKLNQLVALSNVVPIQAVLRELNEMQNNLSNYQPFYAFRAELFRRIGDGNSAVKDYQKAIALCDNSSIQQFLKRKVNTIVNY